MYSYGLLEPGCYYLVQEKENAPIELIKVAVGPIYNIYETECHWLLYSYTKGYIDHPTEANGRSPFAPGKSHWRRYH